MKTTSSFWPEMAAKFFATGAYLAFMNQLDGRRITYVLLLESPKFDSALKLNANRLLSSRLTPTRKSPPYVVPFDVAVMDLAEWNAFYGDFPGRPI